MSDTTMEPVGGLLHAFGAKLAMVSGTCEEHGPAEVLMRVGMPWHCPRCLEAAMAKDTHAKWLSTRTADLMVTATIPAKYVGQRFTATTDEQALIAKASRSVRYITAKGMIGEIQASYGREGKSEEGEIMRFAQYDVLILDEIDALPTKENASLLLTEIINRRYNENKPVIAISNQPFDNLAKFVGERVHSRLYENAFVCDFRWGDFRRASVAQQAAAVREA
jgi:DNA replication protein DnaC